MIVFRILIAERQDIREDAPGLALHQLTLCDLTLQMHDVGQADFIPVR